MPSITIKNIPSSIYRSLKKNARIHHRSLNGEAIACLEQSLGAKEDDPTRILARVDALRNGLKNIRLTENILKKAKNEGRQ